MTGDMQNVRNFTWRDFSFSDFTPYCVNYANFKIVTKQLNLSAITMYTTLISLNNALPRLGYLTQAK